LKPEDKPLDTSQLALNNWLLFLFLQQLNPQTPLLNQNVLVVIIHVCIHAFTNVRFKCHKNFSVRVYFHSSLSRLFLFVASLVFYAAVKKARTGEQLERIYHKKSLENALMQCRSITEKFEGSEETLRLIRCVEESLRKLMITID